ncbi:hypothetical protein ACH4GP_31180 [Streptomyces celluloflavus]|uniref:Uncharacterized protein n=1 Tax=Streptomyces celluloflavus TaxID=58344 RepID=A0ABW7RL36_9ACTN
MSGYTQLGQLTLLELLRLPEAGHMPGQGRHLAAIDSTLPEGKQRLAEALRSLRAQLAPQLQTFEAIATNASRDCRRKRPDKSSISRYFSGHQIAPRWLIHWLHEKASHNEQGRTPPRQLTELLEMQMAAKSPTSCEGCNTLIKTVSHCNAELLTMRSQNWRLSAALARCRDELRHTTGTAGSRKRPPSPHQPVPHLPVPHSRGDRQAEAKDIQAATAITTRLATLANEQKHHEVTAVLHIAPTQLSPDEAAVALVCLRNLESSGLAENLIQVCGRDGTSDYVMRLASRLIQLGLNADADAVLRAAIG